MSLNQLLAVSLCISIRLRQIIYSLFAGIGMMNCGIYRMAPKV
jgi:hypothetical protein